jgi:RHS repeat-associated protein
MKQTDSTSRAGTFWRVLTIVAVWVSLGIAGARMIAQSGGVTSYEDNFQSYGTQKNVPGWVDTSVGSSRPSANGLYKTWPDPLQGSHGSNVVYGSKSSSGSGSDSKSVVATSGGGSDDDDDDDNCHGNDLTTPRTNSGGGSNDDCDHDDDDDDGDDDCHGDDLTAPRTTGVGTNHDDDDDCDDNNGGHRTGTFSTYTKKTFAGAGGFTYRGRFVRTNSDSRIGMTIFSGYPEKDKYYLIGVGKSASNGKMTMQLFSAGAGSPTGTLDSKFTPDPNKWYSFAIRADDVGGKTLIKARFWLSTATEPSTWSIEASDAASGRLTSGRIGIWAAVKGANYVDDLSIKSPVDQVAPVITVMENNTALTEGKKFKYAPVLTIKATDDITPNPVITATLDGTAYTSGAAVTAQGNHTLFVRAVDGAGNASQVTIHFYVDTIAPTVIVQSPTNGSLTSKDVTIAVQADDVTTPVTKTATLNGASWPLDRVITEEREHTLVVTVTDGVGNTTVTPPITFKIDKTPPTWTLKANGTPLTTDDRVFGEDVRVTLEVQDANSPTKTILLNDSTYIENTAITADGEYRVSGSVSDGAGNKVTVPQRRFIIDKTPPEFVITGNGQPMKRYYDGAVNLAITITDRTATTTAAKLNAASIQFPRNVTAEGRYLLEVTVTDALGHARSLPQPIEFFVDLTAPVVTLFANGQAFPHDKIFADDVAVTIRIDDLTPPSSTVTLDSDTVELPKTVSSETPQPHKISAVVSDAVGHTTRIDPIDFIIDKTPPSVTIRNGVGGPVLEEGSYHRVPVRPFIDVTDATPTITDALLDGVHFESGTAVTTEGQHILTGTVKDGALRTATFGPLKFFIDTTPPTGVFMEGTAAFPDGQVLKRNVSARVKTTDQSPPVEVVIHLDGRPEAYQPDTPITEEALHTLTATMKDAAGNTADVPPVTVRIDKTPPGVSLTANGQAFPSGYAFNKDITINADVDEAVQEKWAIINPGNRRVALPYVHSEEGEFTVTGYATDVAGNEGHGPTLPFILEKTPPTVVTFIDNVEAVPNKAYKANVVITFQVSGGLTPRTVNATVNGQPYTPGAPYSNESTKDHPHVIGGKVVTGSGIEANIPPMPFILDKTPPTVTVKNRTVAFPASGAQFNVDVVPVADCEDTITNCKVHLLLDGADWANDTAITAEKPNHAPYVLVVSATDDAGNTFTLDPIEFVIDKTPPLITITAPAHLSTTTLPQVTARGTSDDAVSLTVNETVATLDLGARTFVSPALSLSEGENSITAVGLDEAGNPGTATVRVTVDTLAPQVEVRTPSPRSCVSAADLTVAGVVTDPSIQSVTVRVGDRTVATALAADRQSWTATFANLPEGAHTISIEAKDSLGHRTALAVPVLIDRAPPVLEILESGAPFTAALLNRPVSLTIRARDLDPTVSLVATYHGAPYISGTPITAEGTHHLDVVATDCAGHQVAVPVDFAIDRTPPAVNLLAPANGALVGVKPVALTGNVTDLSGVVRVEIEGTGVFAVPAANGDFTLAAPIAEGANTAPLLAVDAAGNVTRVLWRFTVSSQAPTVSIYESGDLLPDGQVFARPVTLTFQSSDPAAIIAAKVDTFTYTGAEVAADGPHVIEVTATDALSHTGTATRTFTIDRTPPRIHITAPAAGRTASDRIEVRGDADDAVAVFVNGVRATIGANREFVATGVPLELGENVLAATGADAYGNTGRDEVIVTWPGTGPGLIITSPPNGLLTNRPRVDVMGRVLSVTQDGIVTIGTKTVAVDGANAFRLDGYQLEEGENAITVKAVGLTEQQTSASVTVTGDFTPPVLTVLAGGQPMADDAQFPTETSISITASDNRPGVVAELSIDGAARSTAQAVSITDRGGHVLTAIARDQAGNETRVDRTFFIGATASAGGCSITSTDPASNSVVTSPTVTIAGIAPGAASVTVAGVDAQIADGTFIATIGLPQEGANVIPIRCSAGPGLGTGSRDLTLIRATGAPTVDITSPAENFVSGVTPIEVRGTVSADVTEVFINGGRVPAVNGTFFLPKMTLAPGLNIIAATATNAGGRTASDSVRGLYLSEAPSLAITSPLSDFQTGAPAIDVSGSWTDLDPSTLAISVPGATLETVKFSDTEGSYRFRNVPLTVGEQTITVMGRSFLNQVVSTSVKVTRAAAGAWIAIASPADNAYLPGALPIAVDGTYSATGARIDVNGTAATVSPDAAPATTGAYTASTNFSTSGITTPIVARLTDAGNNIAYASVRVHQLVGDFLVREVFPAPAAQEVHPGVIVLVSFTHPVDLSTLDGLTLTGSNGTTVTGRKYVQGSVVSIAPTALLQPGVTYTIGAATSVRDAAGQPLKTAFSSTFTVAGSGGTTPPTVDDVTVTCGQPILIKGTASAGARVLMETGSFRVNGTADAAGNFSIVFPPAGQTGWQVVRVSTVGGDGSSSPVAEKTFLIGCSGPRVVSAAYDRNTNDLTILFSKEVKASTLTVAPGGSLLLVTAEGNTVSGAATVTGNSALVVPEESLTESTFTLTVTTAVTDLGGTRLAAPFTQTFNFGSGNPVPRDGDGYISGEIYDATNGRPLQSAQVSISVPVTAFARTPSPTSNDGRSMTLGGTIASSATTARGARLAATATPQISVNGSADSRGRYTVVVPEGAHTIEVSAPSYTTVWRQIIVPAGAGIVPIDIRLTQRGETKDAGTPLQDGGENDVAAAVSATVPATALPPASRIALTSVGAQSLAGLLPLGWSPLASAELAVFDTTGLLQQDTALAGAQLSFTLPALGTSNQTLSLVHYDSGRDEWRTVTAVLAKGSDGKWSSTIPASGAYAVVYPDRAIGLTPPPDATAGTPLQGVIATCGTTTQPCELTKLAFDVDPKYVTPTQSAVATLQIAGTGTAKFPSGTAVQAYVTETLNLPGGGTVLDAPFATDVLLYRTLDGSEGVAKFQIAPSAKAAQYIIKDGVDQIQILHYPGRLDRGTLIGTEGGRVPGDDSASVEIPSGATLVELKASSVGLTAAERSAYAPIEGFEIVGGFALAIETATPRGRTDQDGDGVPEPLTPVELARPARVTVTVDAASLPHPDAQLLLAEVLEDTPWTRIVRLAVPMTAIDPPQSGAAALRYTTRTIDPTDLPVDGVSHEGRFLVLAAKTDLAWATGTLRLGTAGPYVRDGRIGSFLPDARELGVRDLTRESGLFAVPVAAQPANASWSIVPRARYAGSGKPVQSVEPAPRDQVIKLGDVVLDAQPPVVESISPAANAVVDASNPLVVRIDFNMNVDATSAAAAVTLTNQTSNTAVYGDVTVANDIVTFRPKQPIIAGATYRITVAGTLRGTNGVPFDRSYSSVFSTSAVIPNAEMHLDRVHITMPNAEGTSRIYGDPGAVPGERVSERPWIVMPIRVGTDFIERYQAEVRPNGSFEVIVGGGTDPSDRVTIADTIDLQVVNPAGNIAAVVRLTPFVTADGLGFVAPVGVDTKFTSAEGITVTVPAGAFTEATLVTVSLQANNDAFAVVPGIDNDMRLQRAVKLDFVGTARKRIDVTFPLAADAPRDVQYLLGMLYQSSRGPRVALIDTLRIEDNRLTTAFADTGNSGSGARRISTTSAPDPTAKSCMVSLVSAGIFAPLDLRVATGSLVGFGIISEIAEAVEILQEQWRSLIIPDFTFTRRANCVAVPILSDTPFTITGVDSLTGLEIFKKVYPAIPITDPGVSIAIANPNPDQSGPYPLYAVPIRVESLRMHATYNSKGYTLALSSTGTSVVFTANPSGTPAKQKLPAKTLVRIYNVTESILSGEQFVDANGLLAFSVTAKSGDDLVVYVGEDEVAPETSVNVVFNEPIDVGVIPPGTTEAIRNNLIDDFLRPRLELKLLQDALTTDITAQARFSTDSQNRRLIVTLPASLVRGGRYRLVLKKTLGDPTGNKLGEHQDGGGVPYGNGGTVDFSFEWTVRKNPGQLLGEFQLKVSNTYTEGFLRDLAKSGNIAFVAADSGGVLAYDLSDPGALNTDPATGAQPLPISFVPGAGAPGTYGFDAHWSVAADQHGRIYSGGLMPSFAAIRSYRLEDFIEARDNASAGCGPNVPPHANCKFIGATVVSWRPGYSSALPLSTFLDFGNQAESYPRKIELLEQDQTLRYTGIAGPGSLDASSAFNLENVSDVPGEEGLHKVDIKFATYDSLNGADNYLSQRITVINTDLDLRWSVDIYFGEQATIKDVLVRDTDRVLVARNRITYGLIAMFGQGVGVFDLNAIDSNDVKIRCFEPAFSSAHAAACTEAGTRTDVLERLMTTDATTKASCTPFPFPNNGIPHLNFTPTAHAIVPPRAGATPGTTVYDEMKIYGLDNARGVLDMTMELPTTPGSGTKNCVTRGTTGLVFRSRGFGVSYTHPRLLTIDAAVTNAGRAVRFSDASVFHWEVTADDNARGLRGSVPGEPASRDYLLVAGNAYGLLVVEIGGTQPPNATYDTLQPENLVDVIWVPAGAVAVRVIPNSNLVTILDGKGRLLLADLSNIDQRWAQATTPGVPTTLINNVPFPITEQAMSATGVAGEIGIDDPRIVFKSEYVFATRALAPLVDPHTGIAFGGELVTTDMKVAAVLDPSVEIMVDTGKGLQPSGGVVPLGVEQPIKDPALPASDPNRFYKTGALSAFRVRVSLPGSIARSLPNQRLDLAVESERIYGSDTEQTPLGLPRAHLRRLDRAGNATPRAVDFTLHWAIPSGNTPAEQAEFAKKYRHQSGYNRLISPWIVAIADPRASEHAQGTTTEKAAAGCISCSRPPALVGKTEVDDKVYEFFTNGRFIAVRPGNINATGPYAYLNDQGRMEARVPTTIADTVREKSVVVAAQNPPVAAGMLQETAYVHSGEVEINATDMVVAGRAGIDIPLSRTHRSRTIGGTVLGLGWEAPYLRRLRSLPNGKVEYRDGVGEIWTFEPEQVNPAAITAATPVNTIDRLIGTRVKYKSPAGLFVRLVRHANGWIMFDQQWRVTNFDFFGRVVSDADEFWTPNDPTKGNVVQYAYDSDGHLSQIVDPVGRVTNLKYWKSSDTNSATCFALGNRVNPCTYPGLLGEIEDWRQRKVTFEYDQYGRLIGTQLPAVKPPAVNPAPAVPLVDYSVPDKRPRMEYRYQDADEPQANEPLQSQRYTKFMLLAGNIEQIFDPQEELPGGTYIPRVKWEYGFTPGTGMDRVRHQHWPCANWDGTACGQKTADFVYDPITNPTMTTVTDILGQKREYQWGEKDDKRIHVSKETVFGVPVMKKAYPALPGTIEHDEAPEDTDLVTTYNDYDDQGLFELVTLPSLARRHYTAIDAPNGAPGKIGTVIWEELGGVERFTYFHFDTDPARPNSAATVTGVSRKQDNVEVRHDSQSPSRERKTVKTVDADAKISTDTTFDDQGRQTDTEQHENDGSSASSGALVAKQHMTYNADDNTAGEMDRGRLQKIDSGGGLETTVTYDDGPSGGQVVTVRDEKRRVTTVTKFDSWDRPIERTVTDDTYGVLADEKSAFDATGRMIYSSRLQENVGPVETFIDYDVTGRVVKTRVTGNQILDTPGKTLEQTTRYDFSAAPATIVDTDPYVEGGTPTAQVTSTLDKLGRTSRTDRSAGSGSSGGGTASSTAVALVAAYDVHGQLVYESDTVRTAFLRRNDLFGREIGSVTSDGQRTETRWSGWDQLVESKTVGSGGGTTSHVKQFYTRGGRLRATNELVDFSTPLFPGRARQIRNAWEEGGKKSSVRIGAAENIDDVNPAGATEMRITETTLDSDGRVEQEEYGTGNGISGAIATSLKHRKFSDFTGFIAGKIVDTEPLRAGAAVTRTRTVDGADRIRTTTDGGYVTTLDYDEAGNVRKVTPPGSVGVATASYDGRGLMLTEEKSGGTVERQYDALGNLRLYKDEDGKETTYTTDDLGRVTSIGYPGSSEEIRYDNAGQVAARRDRANNWFAYTYDDGGSLIAVDLGQTPNPADRIEVTDYDDAKRISRIANRDAAVAYSLYDMLGRPRMTKTIRYANGTGLKDPADRVVLDEHTQRHEWSVFDGEREKWTMPVVGDPDVVANAAPWRTAITESWDAGSNLVSQTAGGASLTSATTAGVGRLKSRSRSIPGGTLKTQYAFADTVAPVPGYSFPQLETGLLRSAATSLGTGQPLAGSDVHRNDSLRIGQVDDLGLASRVSSWTYDGRGRLLGTKLLDAKPDHDTSVPTIDVIGAADFREQRQVEPVLSASDHAALNDDALAYTIEPLTWKATGNDAHAVATFTPVFDGVDQTTATFDNVGGRRKRNGAWSYEYDALERLTARESDSRRIEYTYDPRGRVVGRVAFAGAPGAWTVETRATILARDGLPARTTWVWDPISDHLLAMYVEGASAGTGIAPDAGLIRQYTHGDRGYDDPVEVLVASAPGTTPRRYYPVFDEAGSGSLQAVIGSDGNLTERVLYADSFGDAPRYLQGPVVDRITWTATKNDDGEIDEVDIRLHLSEKVREATIPVGARLAAVKSNGDVVLAAADPELEDDATLHWHLGHVEWQTLSTASGAEKLEIAVTNSLRAEGWGDVPVQKAPEWARTLKGIETDGLNPVRLLRNLSNIATLRADGNEEVLYEIRNLYMAATTESKTKLLTDYHGYPFREPADGTIYVRARWYDASTGTFLTPDPMGYTDSSNAYALAANDPVNLSDPTGEILPVIAYLGSVVVNTAVDVAIDYAWHEGTDWWNGTDTDFDWHDSLQTNFAVNLVTGGFGSKLSKLKYLKRLSPFGRKAVVAGAEYAFDVAATGTIDMLAHGRSASEAYGSAAVGGLLGRAVSHGIGGLAHNTARLIGSYQFDLRHFGTASTFGAGSVSVKKRAWRAYEDRVAAKYGGKAAFGQREFEVLLDGQPSRGIADHAMSQNGVEIAVEAKYVGNWSTSIRNPRSPLARGDYGSFGRNIAKAEREKMVMQARRYSAYFDEVIYHSNSPELIRYYSRLFRHYNLSNVRFELMD